MAKRSFFIPKLKFGSVKCSSRVWTISSKPRSITVSTTQISNVKSVGERGRGKTLLGDKLDNSSDEYHISGINDVRRTPVFMLCRSLYAVDAIDAVSSTPEVYRDLGYGLKVRYNVPSARDQRRKFCLPPLNSAWRTFGMVYRVIQVPERRCFLFSAIGSLAHVSNSPHGCFNCKPRPCIGHCQRIGEGFPITIINNTRYNLT